MPKSLTQEFAEIDAYFASHRTARDTTARDTAPYNPMLQTMGLDDYLYRPDVLAAEREDAAASKDTAARKDTSSSQKKADDTIAKAMEMADRVNSGSGFEMSGPEY